MKTGKEIEKNVKEELKWEPRVRGSEINVQVDNGRVTISGNVDSYPKKIDAEKAAMKVEGVTGVVNSINVVIPASIQRTDGEIRKAVMDVIKWNSSIEESKIKVEVKNGWVSLEGEVPWEYQRSRARQIAENLSGVVGVTNLLEVVSTFATSGEVKEKIDSALKRNYYLNTNNIEVQVEASKVLLTGKVHTLAEKKEAETAAWSAPGISEVVNELVVSYSEVFA